MAEYQKQLTPGNRIEVVGQIDSMNSAFRDLGIGILFAAVFVYLLMVVNYQTWGDPFVVILALPATFCGIITMLFITDTTLSVPSLMGAIMAIGVASANSILLVTFAREQQLAGMRAFDAAIAAGRTRIRPVLMTATAMIVGMIPMAIGGAGEEQNAALARAVIGGLLFATPTTLSWCPISSRCCAKATTASPRKAYSQRTRYERDPAAPTIMPAKIARRAARSRARRFPDRARRPKPRRRTGRRLLAVSCSCSVRALGYGFWQHYRLHAEVMATAERAAISCRPCARRRCAPATA